MFRKLIHPVRTNKHYYQILINYCKSFGDEIIQTGLLSTRRQASKYLSLNMAQKSPNVLIYSENDVIKTDFEKDIKSILHSDMYTVYTVTKETLENGAWKGRTALLIIIGSVSNHNLVLNYFLNGGKLFAICSDFLRTVLPYYGNGRQLNRQVVQSIYDNTKVNIQHDLLNYEECFKQEKGLTTTYKGHKGHELDIEVLATEEKFNTPSLLKIMNRNNEGVGIFSQIHLEKNPTEYLQENGPLKNGRRLEIVKKILYDLGLTVKQSSEDCNIEYTEGYFLGELQKKSTLITEWESENKGHITNLDNMSLEWIQNSEKDLRPSSTYLPIHVNEDPKDFSVEEYYKNLTSREIGRVIIFTNVVSSTMNVVGGILTHGIGVVALRQKAGRGRGGNAWITPLGQAAITLQIWYKLSPKLPLIQHAAALAAVNAIRQKPYEDLDIRIKWPNDIYLGREVKIGGAITTANCMDNLVIVNVGTAVNISNVIPTTCLNKIIEEYNQKNGTNLERISLEKFLGLYCSEFERLLDCIFEDNNEEFFELYYKYWLHDNESIKVKAIDSSTMEGVIIGIDEAGWLKIRTSGQVITVAPDGNTFDIMNGLIAPKS